ncbi:MAG TPA: hypothetical protein VFX16_29775 [Pseudonocardiaceae bacterium]|nr:hypothetical protein [Pseudonocardiaceae bacterium]
MSLIYNNTTVVPGKLELLAAWLPGQPWYTGTDSPRLTKAGGFRLDDPAGEVGIEFMVVTDESTGRPVTYHVPLSYRAAPLDLAAAGLIGTMEHGVLGRRWAYDGLADPVLVNALLALVQGEADPQAQSVSDTPDRSVHAHCGAVRLTVAGPTRGTDVPVAGGDYRAVLRVVRVLTPGDTPPTIGHVMAGWQRLDNSEVRGCFAVVMPV